MDFQCLKFMLVLALVEWIQSLPLACLYNGTTYKEGESVVTEELCLSCVCQKGALECNLRVCAEYPKVLPPACFLVHKPNDCCPQLLCEEKLNPTGIELRTGFKLETKIHGNDCMINGSIYAEGSAVASSGVCEYCYCFEGEMKCIKPRCLQSFEGCKAINEKSSCCPTHFDCRDADVDYLTTQINNFEKIYPTVSSDSLKTLWSTDFISGQEYFKANESLDAIPLKKEDILMNESANIATEEKNIEESTIELEKESVIPLTEGWITIAGSHTTETENLNEESSKIANTEAIIFEPEEDLNVSSFPLIDHLKETSFFQTRSKMNFSGQTESFSGNRGNSSSQNVDDYDSYDYSESQLPPSLPNLVIFPFVAADAVVKDENADVPPIYKKEGIERIDLHPVFYKDFSPPVKTEGGFVPKEASKSDESFHEHAYIKEQIEPPRAGQKKILKAQIHSNASPLAYYESCVFDNRETQHREILSASRGCVTCTCHHGAVVCQDFECPHQKSETTIFDNQKETSSIPESHLNVKPLGFKEEVLLNTESQAHFTVKDDLTKLNKNYQTKRPVTVTYRNFVLDFYPNYLVTTTRGYFKPQSGKNVTSKTFGENLRPATETFQETVVPLTTIRTTIFSSLDEANKSAPPKTTRETTKERTAITMVPGIQLNTPETFISEEFSKSNLSKDAKSEKTTSTATKHKYSSKIKEHIIGTETIRVNSTIYLHSWLNSITKLEGASEKAKNQSATPKPAKKEGLKHFPKIPFHQPSASVKPAESKNTKIDFSESQTVANLSSESKKGSFERSGSGDGNTTTIPNAGTLFKLAGCNIYGMMYRVGKIIAELSGPCLECLCTESGVQCRPLKC